MFEQAFQLAKPNARFVIIAVYKQDVPLSFVEMMSKELKVIGASGYTHEDIARVVDHIEKKKTPITTMVTHVYPIDELPKAFDTALAGKETIKVLVDLTS
ncbi:hypothetical protein [Paenibacillus gorillae]|uniref:hypothetical protein n=1 Tax=Paenibacillus gorillae TaxID=1243662 RepID=UPI001EE17705|nr:hypothetical protein [Paenibacillus gorillae]